MISYLRSILYKKQQKNPSMYSIIIPTYNEKDNVSIICESFKRIFNEIKKEYQIIFVDDSSPDGTYNIIYELKEKYPIIALKRNRKSGIGSAYKYAAEFTKLSDFICILDADMSQNPSDLKKFIEIQNKTDCDIVYGTRYNGGTTVNWPFLRRFTSRCANNLAQIILGVDITDFTNSFRLYRASMFRMLIKYVYSNGFSFQMEMMYIAAFKNYKIEQCPVIFYDRWAGESKLGPTEIFQFVKALLQLFCRIDISRSN